MTLDEYGMQLAKTASLRSKDPSTKVGAAILRTNGTDAGTGYNGAPRNVDDEYWMNGPRERKLAVTLHAELNAIIHSQDPSLDGYTIYIYPLPPCCHCASIIAQSGIKRVVCYAPEIGSRWEESATMGARLMSEAGLEIEYL